MKLKLLTFACFIVVTSPAARLTASRSRHEGLVWLMHRWEAQKLFKIMCATASTSPEGTDLSFGSGLANAICRVQIYCHPNLEPKIYPREP